MESTVIVPSDASYPFTVPGFLSDLDAVVKEARAANIKVILGTEPAVLGVNYTIMQQINAVIESYGAANNIPVINYGNSLTRNSLTRNSPKFFSNRDHVADLL